ncbi:MAG: TonB-dependent receptor plug domain-containing protein, partial [Methanosarcinaceae archaeon]
MGSAYTMDIETIEESGAFRWGGLLRRVPGIMVREDINRLRGYITTRGLGHSEVLQVYEGIPAAAMLYGFGCALQQIGIQPERVGGIE